MIKLLQHCKITSSTICSSILPDTKRKNKDHRQLVLFCTWIPVNEPLLPPVDSLKQTKAAVYGNGALKLFSMLWCMWWIFVTFYTKLQTGNTSNVASCIFKAFYCAFILFGDIFHHNWSKIHMTSQKLTHTHSRVFKLFFFTIFYIVE